MAYARCPSGRLVEWKEVVNNPNSPRIKFELDRVQMVRTVDIDYRYYEDFVGFVLGDNRLALARPQYTSTVPATGVYAYIQRYLPWQYPYSNKAGRRWLLASSMEMEGRGVPDPTLNADGTGPSIIRQRDNKVKDANGIPLVNEDSTALYKTARCTIQFDTRTYDILSDGYMSVATAGTFDESTLKRFVTKIYRPEGKNLSLDGNSFYYAGLTVDGAARPLTTGTTKILPSYNLSLTWHLIPQEAVPSRLFNPTAANTAIDDCIGRVNDADFDGYKQGTLLLLGIEIKPMVSHLGDRMFDITYMFKYFNPDTRTYFNNVPGHNHIFYRPFGAPAGTIGWYEAVSNTTLAASATPTNFIAKTPGVNIYDFANMKNLFRPATYRVP